MLTPTHDRPLHFIFIVVREYTLEITQAQHETTVVPSPGPMGTSTSLGCTWGPTGRIVVEEGRYPISSEKLPTAATETLYIYKCTVYAMWLVRTTH